MVGYIAVYTHSDSVTRNKAVGLVKLSCKTDFAARSHEFTSFGELVAQRAVGYDITDYNQLIQEDPSIEQERLKLERATLKEPIIIEEILISSLKDKPKLSAYEQYKSKIVQV